MELDMKKLLPIGLIIIAVMFIMKMMKGRKCGCRENFKNNKPKKIECNCNIERFTDNATQKPTSGHEEDSNEEQYSDKDESELEEDSEVETTEEPTIVNPVENWT